VCSSDLVIAALLLLALLTNPVLPF